MYGEECRGPGWQQGSSDSSDRRLVVQVRDHGSLDQGGVMRSREVGRARV